MPFIGNFACGQGARTRDGRGRCNATRHSVSRRGPRRPLLQRSSMRRHWPASGVALAIAFVVACGETMQLGGQSPPTMDAATGGDEASSGDRPGSTPDSADADSTGGDAVRNGGDANNGDGEPAATADTGARPDKGEGPLTADVMVFPPPNGSGVCPDPPLRLTFSGPPTLGASGKIQVFDASQAAIAVASVDMAARSFTDTIGGVVFNIQRPAYVDGDDVVVKLPTHALGYGKTYFVTVDAGAITGPGGAVAVTGMSTWRFSTAPAAPSSTTHLAVALDGSGAFCSVQGALDAIPQHGTSAATVAIAPGTYHEIIHFASRDDVTLVGQDRATTVIEGTNNNTLNPSTSTRSLVGVDSSTGIVFDSLTIHNLTPQGGSQAEALRLQTCDRCVVRNSDILSLQDTLLWSGRIYASHCTIAGNVDFVWGTGAAYFDHCEIKTVVRAGANVQARNPASGYGYVFVDSELTADPGITGQTLARIDVGTYPASHVAYIGCQLGSHIAPAGWMLTAGTDTSQLRFWEYQSVDPSGALVDVSHRMAGSKQLSATEAAMMRDPTVVLSGWQPPP
jgi:pectin methylesterase-like acyl-CoA thioesterase